MRKINTETIALTGVTAAVYMVATLAISPIAYGSVQFRISGSNGSAGLDQSVIRSRTGSWMRTVKYVQSAWHNRRTVWNIPYVLFGNAYKQDKKYVFGITLAYDIFIYHRFGTLSCLWFTVHSFYAFGNGRRAYMYHAHRMHRFLHSEKKRIHNGKTPEILIIKNQDPYLTGLFYCLNSG